MSVQGRLLTMLPVGVFHLREFLNLAEQEAVRDELREVARQAPFYTPQMPGGVSFKLRITNCGAVGWTADEAGFRYVRHHPNGRRWPSIPPQALDAAVRAAAAAGFKDYAPNVCLINYYERGTGSLGLHRDDTRPEDFTQPIVTISLGDSCEYGIGGDVRDGDVLDVDTNSGDVWVMGAAGRMLYHRVRNIAGNSPLLAKGGRISATFRRVRV